MAVRGDGARGAGKATDPTRASGEEDPRYARILVATDGSGCSLRAAGHAAYLAGRLGAELFALNVVNVERAFRAGVHFGEAVAELEKSGREALEAVRELAWEKGVGCEAIQAQGSPHKAIIEVSDGIGADLVIVGSTGMTSVGRVLVGSESEKVLRYSSRPVLLVREPENGDRPASEEAVSRNRSERGAE